MLENTISIVVSLWFLIIPIIFEIICFKKQCSIPRFFKSKSSTRYIVLSMLLFLTLFRVDMYYFESGVSNTIRYYNIFCVIIVILWEIIKYLIVNKHSQSLKDFESVKVCMAIDYYIDNGVGYNIYKNKYSISIGVWDMMRDSVSIKCFNESELSLMREYLVLCRKHFIKLNNVSMLYAVIKMEFKFLNYDKSIKDYYYKCLYNPENNEEESVKIMLESKSSIVKNLKEMLL